MYFFPNFESFHCFMTSSNYCFLTCMQVSQEAGKVFWHSYLLKNFHNMLWFTQSKALAQSIKQKKDIFLEFSCSFYDLDVGILISGFSAFSKSSLYIWMFSVHILLKPILKDFKYYLSIMWNECSCMVVWTFFIIAHVWDWNENWAFPLLWPLLSFPNLLTYWVQHFNSIIFSDLK